MGKVTPFAQRAFIDGNVMERSHEKVDLNERVHKFILENRGKLFEEREAALMRVITTGEVAFVEKLITLGGWHREVEACSKKTRWLKSLKKEET